jgi:hypothetical protein
MILSLPLSPMRFWRMLEDEKPTLLQMDFQGIIRFGLQRRIKPKPPL